MNECKPLMDGSEYHAATAVPAGPGVAPTVVLINVSPIEYGHVLLCPRVTDCLPQRIDPAAGAYTRSLLTTT